MLHALLAVVAYVVLLAVFLSLLLRLFGATFRFVDVLLASVVASLISLIPGIGSTLSVLGIIAVMHFRCDDISLRQVLFSSALARISAWAVAVKLLSIGG